MSLSSPKMIILKVVYFFPNKIPDFITIKKKADKFTFSLIFDGNIFEDNVI
jgi:hypothetical protein